VKHAVWLSLVGLLLCSSLASGVQFDSISIGFHVIPSIERADGADRAMDLSLSIGANLILDSEDSIDMIAILDSQPSSLGTSVQFNHRITDPLRAGLGVTVLWPFSDEQKLQWPILSAFAHAVSRSDFYPEFWGETGLSIPLLTLANQAGAWSLLPLLELPTFYLAGDVRVVPEASIQMRVTFQPVITDTTALLNPIGRISDELLVIWMGSAFLRYLR